MNVAVLAGGSFAIPLLDAIADSEHRLAGVVSRPDRPHGRGRIATPSPAALWAMAGEWPLLRPIRVSVPSFEPEFRALGADVAVVADFGEILKPFVFAWTRHGFFGLHPSLLPRWRGAAPIPWTILSGDGMTGVSVFKISASVDTGHVALSETIPVCDRETGATLAHRLAKTGAVVMLEALRHLQTGSLTLTPQPPGDAPVARKLRRLDGMLRWETDAFALDRVVRALVPWPCAWCQCHGREVKVLRSFPLSAKSEYSPGTVVGATVVEGEGEGVRIACGSGELVLLELQSPGKLPLPALVWLRGARLAVGDVLPGAGFGESKGESP
ncbi:methionyl-tRNA formyltransferase [Candidatus Fermentibacteria bacterium]|nr:methionyl-tRNA formyltransferase [Candidatus Fermentibacteria bacterium]